MIRLAPINIEAERFRRLPANTAVQAPKPPPPAVKHSSSVPLIAPPRIDKSRVVVMNTGFRDFRKGDITFQKNADGFLLTEDDRFLGKAVKVDGKLTIRPTLPPFYLDNMEVVPESELEKYNRQINRAPQPIGHSISFIPSRHELEEYEENYGKWNSNFEEAQAEANEEGYYDEVWEENWRAVKFSEGAEKRYNPFKYKTPTVAKPETGDE
jgi:hypothetical protein